MDFPQPGRAKNAAEFSRRLRALDPGVACDAELLGRKGPLGTPFEIEGRTLRNRFAVHPMEGWDGTADGMPTDLTLRRWHRFGLSGAALLWGGEAFAVSADGRANPRQLHHGAATGIEGGLAQLLAHVRAGRTQAGFGSEPMLAGLQLTHSGRYARDAHGPTPRLVFHHPLLDERVGAGPDTPLLTDGQLEGLVERYVAAARLAWRVGFDFVDVKCCHGYLLHEVLAGKTRPGPYGGSFENRTRLLREIIAGIRAEAPGLAVGVRVSIEDRFPYAPDPKTGVGAPLGWESQTPYRFGFGVDEDDPRQPNLAEPHRLLALLTDLEVRLVNITLGSPYYCPHLQRPAAYPPSDGYRPPEDPLLSVTRHLRAVRACRALFPSLVLVGSGYSYLQEWLPHVAQAEVRARHVDFVGLGRMILSYPELPADVLMGRPLKRKAICRTFSDCTTAPRRGLPSGCYPLDPAYRSSPDGVRLRGMRAKRSQTERNAP